MSVPLESAMHCIVKFHVPGAVVALVGITFVPSFACAMKVFVLPPDSTVTKH
jgi:hypothetical protein